MTRTSTGTGTAVVLFASCVVLAACVPRTEAVPSVLPVPTATSSHGAWPPDDDGLDQPPPFEVRYGHEALVLHASTFCYGSGCADGWDEHPPSVGSPDRLYVHVPDDDLDELVVTQTSGDDECSGRTVEAAVEPIGAGWWVVRPRGPADEYRTTLFASGEGTGDMVADVSWRTPSDEPLPDASATLALVADHDGQPDSYGLELSVVGLPTTPEHAAARVVVTAANGRSATIDAERSTGCVTDGVVLFDGPHDEAVAAARLGGFPFTTRVELELDGVRHVAEATYPDDEIADLEPHVALEFSPPLP